MRIAINAARRDRRAAAGSATQGAEQTGRSVEAVEVFGRTQFVLVVAGLRRQREFGRYLEVDVEFERVVLRAIGGRQFRLDVAQIGGLDGVGIRIDRIEQEAVRRTAARAVEHEFARRHERKGLAVRRLERFR